MEDYREIEIQQKEELLNYLNDLADKTAKEIGYQEPNIIMTKETKRLFDEALNAKAQELGIKITNKINNKKVLKTEIELEKLILKSPLEMSEKLTNEIDNTAYNELKSNTEVVLPKAPNRATRRALWKQDEKFRKKFKNELKFLEKYVEDNGLESLSKYLEEKNKD